MLSNKGNSFLKLFFGDQGRWLFVFCGHQKIIWNGIKYYFRCGCFDSLSINYFSRFSISNLEKLQKERCLWRLIHFVYIILVVLFNLDNSSIFQTWLDNGCGVCTRNTFHWHYFMPNVFLSKKPLRNSKAFFIPSAPACRQKGALFTKRLKYVTK